MLATLENNSPSRQKIKRLPLSTRGVMISRKKFVALHAVDTIVVFSIGPEERKKKRENPGKFQ